MNPQVEWIQIDGWIFRREIQARRQLAVAEGQYRFDQAGDAGRRLEVTNVGLDGSDQQRTIDRASRAQHGTKRCGFHWIANRSAGAVQFDMGDVCGIHTGSPVCDPQQLRLSLDIGDEQTTSSTVVVHRTAVDDTMDVVTVSQRLCQRLEHHQPAALAPGVAVGPCVEGETAAARRQRAKSRHGNGALRGDVEVDSPSEREPTFTSAKALDRHVHGHQRGGLARVDHHAGTTEPEEMGDPIGDDASLQARNGVMSDHILAMLMNQRRVVVPHGPDEHTGRLAPGRFGQHPSVFQRLPAQFQCQPLLGIHPPGLTGRNTKEQRIKGIDLSNEPAVSDFHLMPRHRMRL